jgi:hypothetical protein
VNIGEPIAKQLAATLQNTMAFNYLLYKDKLVEDDLTCVGLKLRPFEEMLAV